MGKAKLKRNPLSYPTGTTMRVGGEVLSKTVVRFDYRCVECLSPLRYRNAGVVCTQDVTHHGFIHKTEADRIAAEQAAALAQVEQDYQIIDGLIVPRKDPLQCQ